MRSLWMAAGLLACAGLAWATPLDTDGDGIPDTHDKCPTAPEDRDGFQDTDGCPDVDNDGDKIVDAADRCPNEAETYNGMEDADGCPDAAKKVTLSGGGRSYAPAAPAAVAPPAPAPPPARTAPMGAGASPAPVATPAKRVASRGTPIANGVGEAPLQVAASAAGRLTAGEWRDTDHWDFWTDLRRRQGELTPDRALAGFGLQADHLVTVSLQRAGGGAAVDQPVALRDGDGRVIARARTDVHGRAQLVYGTANAPLRLDVAGARHAVMPGKQYAYTVDAKPAPQALDVMLVVDVTGSMCDELAWLKRELADVLERALDAAPDMRLRTSVNAYRDHGDAFVVKPAPFRKTPTRAAEDLSVVSCGGGGDTPEAVDEALVDAIEKHTWSRDATARLLFLVLDAPPHQTQAVQRRLRRSVAAAQAKGVRIIAVAGSGIDKSAEFFLRGVSALTGGTYVFLTDHSGIGHSHIKPTVGPHAIEALNELMVRLIQEAVGRRSSAPAQAQGR